MRLAIRLHPRAGGGTFGAGSRKRRGVERGRTEVGGVFGNRWWVVFASACGLMVGAVHNVAFAIFLKPVTDDLGISRTSLSAALFVTSTLSALGCLPLGYLLDRFGVRRIMMPGLVLYALGVAGWALLTANPLVIYGTFAFAGLFGAIGSPVPYGTALSVWFDRQRGLAIGVALTGISLGVAFIPQLAMFFIRSFGWRTAYVLMGATVLVLAWVPVAIFVREPTALDQARHVDVAPFGTALPGMATTRAILGSWRFWALTVAFFLSVIAINGTLSHTLALLADRGIPIQTAIVALSVSGMGAMSGRIVSGFCLDLVSGALVAIVVFVIPMAGIFLLMNDYGVPMSIAAAGLCGFGAGAEAGMLAFFVSRYFGLKAYGRIFGTMFAAFALANGIGPVLAGWSYDKYHSYTPAFTAFEAMLVVTCMLIAPLGAYPFPKLPGVAVGILLSRSEFFGYWLGVVLAAGMLNILSSAIGAPMVSSFIVAVAGGLQLYLITLRLHDAGFSGWWCVLVPASPLIGLLLHYSFGLSAWLLVAINFGPYLLLMVFLCAMPSAQKRVLNKISGELTSPPSVEG
jgi:MFS family permease